MFRSHAVPPLRDRTSGLSRGQKGLFFDLFSPLGARKRALRRNCAARRVETSYLRARAERGAAGASRGRAGAEKRKSRFLGRVGTTLSRMKLYCNPCPSILCLFVCLTPVPEGSSKILYLHFVQGGVGMSDASRAGYRLLPPDVAIITNIQHCNTDNLNLCSPNRARATVTVT